MNFYEAIVNQRLRNLSPYEIMDLAMKNGLTITENQAQILSQMLRSSHVNIFNDQERFKLLGEVATVTSPHVASEMEKLFQQYTAK